MACVLASFAAHGVSSARADTSTEETATSGMAIPEKARFLADRGRQLQRDGKFAEALEAYKAAYVLAPSPGLLFNLAQAYRLNGDCDDAAWMYRRFLDTDPREDLRSLVNDHLAKLQACMHVGFRTQIETPPVPPSGKDNAMPSQPARAVVAVAEPSNDGQREQQVGTYVMIGGGAALVVAAAFAYEAHSASNDVADAYRAGMRAPDIHSIDDRGQRDATIATVASITGGAALITGAVLYSLGRRDERAQHLAVVPHPGGGEVRLAWRF
jgi:tetratricopeptide (TPR) repeat protein